MNEIERDREVGTAWRAASREEPPPALDAAIRAEARRAVGAAPGRERSKHWWYPLAAAATVAVLAVSIVQLMPPEQVAPTVVAEQSAVPRAAQNEVARQSAGADARLAAPPPAAPAAPSATPTPRAKMPSAPPRDQGVAGGAIERERAAAPAQAPEALAKKQLAEAKEEAPARAKLAQPPPEKPDAAPAATFGGIRAPSLPRSEPFPAKTAPPEARRDIYADEAQKPAANAAAGSPAVQASGRAVRKTQVESRVAAATVANTDEAKAKDVGALSVEDRIKRIRDLKNQGRVDDAAKELAAFRAAFGERADAFLPPDLRTWAQAAPTPTTK